MLYYDYSPPKMFKDLTMDEKQVVLTRMKSHLTEKAIYNLFKYSTLEEPIIYGNEVVLFDPDFELI